MEPNKNFLEKNKTLLTYAVMGLIVVVVLIGGALSKYETETPHETEKNSVENLAVATTTSENVQQVANTSATITPLVEEKKIESGRGEVTFIVSSQSGAEVVREIHLHNPAKDSWVLAYDGYKTVSSNPTEVYRVTLAAIEYDKVQIRTLGNFFIIESPVKVKNGESVRVELGI